MKTPAAWELAVPNGDYDVTLSVGDAADNFDSTHRIRIEGQVAIASFVPSASEHFKLASARATVTDGRLTVDAVGGTNTKLDYVIVKSVETDTTPPAAPANVSASAGDGQVALSWNANTESDLAGYDVYRGTSLPVSTERDAAERLDAADEPRLHRPQRQQRDDLLLRGHGEGHVRQLRRSRRGQRDSAGGGRAPTLKFNFQPAGAPVPSGFTADTGAAYSDAAGQGWVREDSLSSASHVPLDISPNTRDRNLITDQSLDTMIHMQYPAAGTGTAVKTPAAWELKVPNGDYEVSMSVGDSDANFDSTHRIRVEGQVAIDSFVPTTGNRFKSATVQASVSDGRLTVDAVGGTNTKLDYVTVKSIGGGDTTPPAAPTGVSASAGDGQVALSWNANTESDLAGYDVYRSTSLPVGTGGTPLNGSTLTGTSYVDHNANNGTTYYYVVVAKDTSGNRATSSPVSGTPQGTPSLDKKINFQPAGAPVPSGFTADTGAAYSSTAGQGWVREDSLANASHTPLDITVNTRDRNVLSDQSIDTMIHMQYPASASGASVKTPAAWELKVPNGSYTVKVAVGDAAANYDSTHRIRIEGQVAISAFQPASDDRFATAKRTVNVADGLLTIDAVGGVNTKLDYVTVSSDVGGSRPSVTAVNPADGATGTFRDAPVTAEVDLPNVGDGIDPATLNSNTVHLTRSRDGAAVAANLNTTGGGDAIIVQPTANLDANTRYTFEVTNGLKDFSGAAFLPFDSSFTTGTATSGGGGSGDVAFQKVPLPTAQGQMFTSVAVGPDGKLYAATYDGLIYRFPIAGDGTTGNPEIINSIQTANGGTRTIIGLAFDPASTASAPILWVSHTEEAFNNGTDWTGKITRLSGPALGPSRTTSSACRARSATTSPTASRSAPTASSTSPRARAAPTEHPTAAGGCGPSTRSPPRSCGSTRPRSPRRR